jgi:hypothetical protein
MSRMPKTKRPAAIRVVVCLKNDGYPVRKLYRVLPDAKAASHHMIRVINESGEDYLYPADFFAPVDLPKEVVRALELAA